MIPTPCLEPGCPHMAQPGPRRARCKAHQRAWDAARNARPERQVYRERGYAQNVTGQVCAIGYPDICTGWATTVDHIVPWSQGGTDHASNLRPACLPCNSARPSREPWCERCGNTGRVRDCELSLECPDCGGAQQ